MTFRERLRKRMQGRRLDRRGLPVRANPLALCVAILCCATNAWGDEAPHSYPIVTGSRVEGIKTGVLPRRTVLASPTISETTAVRMPDGSIALVCEQRRNPKARVTNVKMPAPAEPQP